MVLLLGLIEMIGAAVDTVAAVINKGITIMEAVASSAECLAAVGIITAHDMDMVIKGLVGDTIKVMVTGKPAVAVEDGGAEIADTRAGEVIGDN